MSIVGVTSESKEKTEPWIKKTKAGYPYAYDNGGKLSKSLNVKGIPAAFLVNPKGKVVWSGHPGGLSSSIIKKNLKGSKRGSVDIGILTRGWPKSASSARKLLEKNQIGKALVQARKLAEKDENVNAAIETLDALAQEVVEKIKSQNEIGDILGVLDAAKVARKSLAGVEQALEVEAIVKEIKASETSAKIVKAQMQLVKLNDKAEGLRKRKDAQRLIKKLDKLIAKNAENYAGKSAEKLKADITEKMDRLR